MDFFDRSRKAAPASKAPSPKKAKAKLPPKVKMMPDGSVVTTTRHRLPGGRWITVRHKDPARALLREVYEMAKFRDPEYAYKRLEEIRRKIEDSNLLRG